MATIKNTSTKYSKMINNKELIDQDIVLKLFKKGDKLTEIHEQTGFDFNLILMFLKPYIIERAKTLKKREAMSQKDIAQCLDISPAALSRYLSESSTEEAFYLFKKGQDADQIANELGLPTRTLYNILKQLILKKIKTMEKTHRPIDIRTNLGLPSTTFKRFRSELRMLDKVKELQQSPATIPKMLTMLQADRKITEIAKEFSVKPKYVKQILTPHIILRHLQLGGIANLQEEFRIDARGLTKILTNAKVLVPESGLAKKISTHYNDGEYQFDCPISPYLEEVLVGELLGDGYIRNVLPADERGGGEQTDILEEVEIKVKIIDTPSLQEYRKALDTFKDFKSIVTASIPKIRVGYFNQAVISISKSRTAIFILHKAIQEQKWINHIGNLIQDSYYPIVIAERTHYDKKKEKEIETIYLTTKSSVQLHYMREKFYPEGIKIVPKDLVLTPNIVLHWFIGDGSASKYIVLSTDNFQRSEVEMLSTLIRKTIGIEMYIMEVRDKDYPDKIYYRLRTKSVNALPKFYAYIDGANQETINIAKEIFPWKFDFKIRKKDVIKIKTQ